MLLFELDAASQPIMIVVHPGSCCGSANANLGKSQASGDRDYLAQDIASWSGGILVVDGEMSDELSYYNLGPAIDHALVKAQSSHYISGRVFACDETMDDWPAVVLAEVQRLGLTPQACSFAITGAWYDPSNRSGCVNATYDVLRGAGFRYDVRDSAFELDFFDDSEDEKDDEEDDFLTEGVQSVNPGEIIEYMVNCILTGKYWDTLSVDKKPHLRWSWDTAIDMVQTWHRELPKHVLDIDDIHDRIETPEFAELVRGWAVARYKEVMIKLEAVPHPGGHYRIHRTIKVNPHYLVMREHTKLGVYWTYDRNSWDDFEPIWSTHRTGGKDIVIEADVVSSSIDWRTTILANMDWESGDREYEIRLFPLAPVTVLDILDLETDRSLGLDFSKTVFAA
jgi:hypothetical protein